MPGCGRSSGISRKAVLRTPGQRCSCSLESTPVSQTTCDHHRSSISEPCRCLSHPTITRHTRVLTRLLDEPIEGSFTLCCGRTREVFGAGDPGTAYRREGTKVVLYKHKVPGISEGGLDLRSVVVAPVSRKWLEATEWKCQRISGSLV